MPPFAPTCRRPAPPSQRVGLTAVVLAALLIVGAGTGAATSGSRQGGWQPPVEGRTLERFDPPARPWLPGHRGVDLAAPAGTPVVAPAPGIVTFAGQVGGKPVVVLSHGELRSTFEPVESRADVGDRIVAGEIVGQVATGAGSSHCAPIGCLHWGVRRGTTYLDPLALLGRATPIVLLPLSVV